MLCDKITKEELKDTYFNNTCWKANIKYDGERIIAIKKDGEVFLVNRRGNIKNSHYLEVVESLNACEGDFILDGEVITHDDNFNKLQRRALTKNPHKQEQLRKELPVIYMVFDVLNYQGKDLRQMPLKDRLVFYQKFISDKSIYQKFISDKSIGFVAYENIYDLLPVAELQKCEGIILKNMNAKYEGRRSKDWLKLKFFKNTNLKLITYTINNAGIRCEDEKLNVVQVSGHQHKEVKDKIDGVGYCDVTIQYLEQGKTGRYRFPSFVKITELNNNNQES